MDELVKAISEQAGIPEEQAQKAAAAAMSFLKDKLPAPLASQLESALDNPGVTKSATDMISTGLGMFGKK